MHHALRVSLAAIFGLGLVWMLASTGSNVNPLVKNWDDHLISNIICIWVTFLITEIALSYIDKHKYKTPTRRRVAIYLLEGCWISSLVSIWEVVHKLNITNGARYLILIMLLINAAAGGTFFTCRERWKDSGHNESKA